MQRWVAAVQAGSRWLLKNSAADPSDCMSVMLGDGRGEEDWCLCAVEWESAGAGVAIRSAVVLPMRSRSCWGLRC